jgi:hypothetical protein
MFVTWYWSWCVAHTRCVKWTLACSCQNFMLFSAWHFGFSLRPFIIIPCSSVCSCRCKMLCVALCAAYSFVPARWHETTQCSVSCGLLGRVTKQVVTSISAEITASFIMTQIRLVIEICVEVLTAVTITVSVCWVAAPCLLVWVYRRLRILYYFHLMALMKEAVQTSETLLNSYNPEDGHLYSHRNFHSIVPSQRLITWNLWFTRRRGSTWVLLDCNIRSSVVDS